MSESFAELFEQSLKEITVGNIINAEIVDISKDFVILNAGLKSEAYVPVEQFFDVDGNLKVAIGDEVEVALEAFEDGYGNTRMSHEKAIRIRAWTDLETIYEKEETIEGRILNRVKGGFTVLVNNLRAFLPGSQVDVRPVTDPEALENKDFDFKIIKLDRALNNIVVSRRAIIETELSAERKELLENLEEGQVVKGIVKNITDYGAFISLGGLDGLLHITDLAWRRIKHPSEVLEIGQEIDARVLKFDREKNRVSLGIKQLTEDPWKDIQRRYPEGARVFGKVTNITDYGSFVELEDGVEGLVHSSEMDWTNKNIHPSKITQVSDDVEVMILDIDEDRRRISLGMKQCQSNPWEDFAQSHAKGEKVTGNIKSITDFGVFVGLDGGIDGLIHLSDLSWEDEGEESVRNYKKGDEIVAVILAVDAERERISLGLKQASGDPFTQFLAANAKGSVVKAVVVSVDESGVEAMIDDEVEAFMRAGEASLDGVADLASAFEVGSSFEAKVTSIERKNRKVMLSVKAFELGQQGDVVEEYSRRPASTGTSLGDKLKQQLESSADNDA